MNANDIILALALHIRTSPAGILKIIRTAPHRYRHYQIDKRSGGKRDIYHPTPELKAIQRWIITNLLSKCDVSDAVQAYEPGKSISKHAQQHRFSNYFLKLDFTDFFPSIDIHWVNEFLTESLPFLESDGRAAISRLLCRYAEPTRSLALSIGAPSSPAMSNRILYKLDNAISTLANERKVLYTRYADDLYFSARSQNVLRGFETDVRSLVKVITPKLHINEQKTVNTSRKHRVMITGLILTPQRDVSLGRHLKRRIKTEIHLWLNGNLADEDMPTLQGMVAYAAGVERSFISRLARKFGDEAIARLLRKD